MSLLTQAHLLDKYGPRLNAEQTAEALGITVKALHNQRSAGTFGIVMYLDGGKLWADYRERGASEARSAGCSPGLQRPSAPWVLAVSTGMPTVQRHERFSPPSPPATRAGSSSPGAPPR